MQLNQVKALVTGGVSGLGLAVTRHIIAHGGKAVMMDVNDEAGAAAVDYLMYSGYVTLAYFWARMAVIARKKIAEADGDTSFYQSKLMTAQFYFERLLPRTESLKKTMLSGAENLMQMPEELFAI